MWYRLAAERGHPGAQSRLAMMYDSGQGVPQDYKEAAKWYRVVAELRNPSAQYRLGVMYSKGEGVSQDYIQAHMWFSLATASGAAIRSEAKKSCDELAEKMTPEQIEKAQDLARNWKPKLPLKPKNEQ
jgi:TPR repeat protein